MRERWIQFCAAMFCGMGACAGNAISNRSATGTYNTTDYTACIFRGRSARAGSTATTANITCNAPVTRGGDSTSGSFSARGHIARSYHATRTN